MSELQQLKERIKASGKEGIETSIIRDDYEPAGDMMIRNLLDSGEFVTLKVNYRCVSTWKIFEAGQESW